MTEYQGKFEIMSAEVRGFIRRMNSNASPELLDLCAKAVMRIGEGDSCVVCDEKEAALLFDAPWLVGRSLEDRRPFVLSGTLLYTRRNFLYELIIRNRLDEMSRRNMTISGMEQGSLRDEQYKALQLISDRQFAILSGGPGTGKTFTIAQAVKNSLRENPGLKIRLCAPTAKASQRLMDSMGDEFCKANGIEATTIHRLLKPNNDLVTFKHNHDNPLVVDWLIVDEVSMLGLPLMAKLLDALPNGCRLTLAGDKDQLASVERGCIFADLCKRYKSSLGVINESRRFLPNGGIARLAKAVNAGNVNDALTILRDNEDVQFFALQENDAFRTEKWQGFKEMCLEKMKQFANAADFKTAKEHLNDFRVLCALREGPFGVEYNNNMIKDFLPPTTPVPWLITRNDPQMEIVNGAMALEFPDDRENLCLIDEDSDTPRRIPKSLVQYRELGFAITVHKSQGSEYGDVCLVLPATAEASILTREILYTAITRTKNSVALYGGEDALKRCISHSVSRVSGLAL